MAVVYLQHVQVNVPAGREGEARRFYTNVIGLAELDRPQSLSDAGRKGMWFRVGGDQELHVFVNPDGAQATGSQHPALIVDDLDALRDRLVSAGCEIEDAIPIEGRARYFTRDPGGNRLEFLTLVSGSSGPQPRAQRTDRASALSEGAGPGERPSEHP